MARDNLEMEIQKKHLVKDEYRIRKRNIQTKQQGGMKE